MARGRMLNKSIALSDKFAALPDDTCRLLATWTISFLDYRGVFYGDAAIVRSQIMPLSDTLTNAKVAEYIKAMEDVGLVQTFEAKGRKWQAWPGFVDNQIGLRSDREGTDFPPPPNYTEPSADSESESTQEDIPQDSGNHPAKSPPNRKEKKRSTKETQEKVSEENPESSDSAQSARKPDEFFDKLAEITHAEPKLQGSLIGRTKAQLLKVNATLQELDRFNTYWYAADFRGMKGQSPTLPQIVSEWGKAKAWQPNQRPPQQQQRPNEPAGFANLRKAAGLAI